MHLRRDIALRAAAVAAVHCATIERYKTADTPCFMRYHDTAATGQHQNATARGQRYSCIACLCVRADSLFHVVAFRFHAFVTTSQVLDRSTQPHSRDAQPPRPAGSLTCHHPRHPSCCPSRLPSNAVATAATNTIETAPVHAEMRASVPEGQPITTAAPVATTTEVCGVTNRLAHLDVIIPEAPPAAATSAAACNSVQNTTALIAKLPRWRSLWPCSRRQQLQSAATTAAAGVREDFIAALR